jgi:phosphoglycolate phosphatase
MYNAILFDLDGTLTDPKEGITKCVQYALEKMGFYEPEPDRLLCFIGPPLVDSFMEFYNMPREDANKAVEYYRERFTDIGIYENSLIEGIPKLLEKLKEQNKIIALATSKPHVFARRVLEHFGLTKYFDIIVGAEFDGTRNEKKDVIAEVLRRLPKNSAPVMVGDRRQDVIGAKICCVPCVGVRFGYAEENELEDAGADAIAENVDELYKILTE